MKKIILTLVAALTMTGTLPVWAEDSFSLEDIHASDISRTGGAIPSAGITPAGFAGEKAAAIAQKEWTIMVFMNAKNDLEDFALTNMNQLELIGSTSKINIVVEFGRMKGYSAADGDWSGVRRYYVTRDLNPFKVTSTIVQNLGMVNMGDWKEVAKFGQWAKAAYPARHYMLIIWNHGGGWTRDNPVADKGISYDAQTGNNLDTPQLGRTLAQIGKIDIYASDACLMQMAEVAYEVHDYADYLVGSEETEPGSGYEYHKMLLPLALMPSLSPLNLSKLVVDSYMSSNLIDMKTAATQSVVDAGRMKGLAVLSDNFVSAVMASGDKALAKAVRARTQKYFIEDNKDFYHFAKLMAEESRNSGVKRTAGALMEYIKNTLILHSRTALFPVSHSYGIAVYLPDTPASYDYSQLKWARNTKWPDFIKWMTSK